MMPKMLSHPIEPLTFLFFTSVASTLAAGSVTAVSFARNFQSVPVALIGVSIALAAFPALSAAWAAGDRTGVRAPRPANVLTIGVLTHDRGAVALAVVGPHRHRGAARRRRVRRRGRGASRRPCSRRSRSPSRSTPSGHLVARGLYATHNTVLPGPRVARRVRRDDRGDARARDRRWASSRSRSGSRPGRRPGRAPGRSRWRGGSGGAPIPGDARRARRARRPPPSGRAAGSGTTAMNRPSRCRVVALGPLPRQVVAAHLGHVLEGRPAGRTAPQIDDTRGYHGSRM